jgi:hypothetical protein
MQTMNFLGVSGHVEFSENTTDRLVTDSSYFVIDNLQYNLEPSNSNTDVLHAVEVLKLNDNTNNINCKSTTQWIDVGNPIQWPRGLDEEPLDYAILESE